MYTLEQLQIAFSKEEALTEIENDILENDKRTPLPDGIYIQEDNYEHLIYIAAGSRVNREAFETYLTEVPTTTRYEAFKPLFRRLAEGDIKAIETFVLSDSDEKVINPFCTCLNHATISRDLPASFPKRANPFTIPPRHPHLEFYDPGLMLYVVIHELGLRLHLDLNNPFMPYVYISPYATVPHIVRDAISAYHNTRNFATARDMYKLLATINTGYPLKAEPKRKK